MKRSQKILSQARHSFWMAITVFSAACCAGVWSVRAFQSSPSGGAVVGLIALTGLLLAASIAAEFFRLLNLHRIEERLEWQREVRPRL